MIVSILSDNRTAEPDKYRTEHGMSALLKTDKYSILLDTGASELFMENADTMGLDLSDLNYVFISHGHADHAGGLESLLRENLSVKVLVSPYATSARFHSLRGGEHCISPKWPLDLMEGRTTWIDSTLEIAPGIKVIAGIRQSHSLPLGNCNLLAERDGVRDRDDFRHEMALYVDGLLFTGCAHNGLENILEACPWPVHTVLGGFHLLDSKGENRYETTEQLEELSSRLVSNYPDTIFYTSHCTGDNAFSTMHSVMGDHLRQFSCGMLIDIERQY